MTEEEMMKVRNLGRKSLEEVQQLKNSGFPSAQAMIKEEGMHYGIP